MTKDLTEDEQQRQAEQRHVACLLQLLARDELRNGDPKLPLHHAKAIRSFIRRYLGPNAVRGIRADALGVPWMMHQLVQIVTLIDEWWLETPDEDVSAAIAWLEDACGRELRPRLESLLKTLPHPCRQLNVQREEVFTLDLKTFARAMSAANAKGGAA